MELPARANAVVTSASLLLLSLLMRLAAQFTRRLHGACLLAAGLLTHAWRLGLLALLLDVLLERVCPSSPLVYSPRLLQATAGGSGSASPQLSRGISNPSPSGREKPAPFDGESFDHASAVSAEAGMAQPATNSHPWLPPPSQVSLPPPSYFFLPPPSPPKSSCPIQAAEREQARQAWVAQARRTWASKQEGANFSLSAKIPSRIEAGIGHQLERAEAQKRRQLAAVERERMKREEERARREQLEAEETDARGSTTNVVAASHRSGVSDSAQGKGDHVTNSPTWQERMKSATKAQTTGRPEIGRAHV